MNIPNYFSQREHSEFHNCHTEESVKQDIAFLRLVYGDKLQISETDVTKDFINNLKVISKDIYFFIDALEKGISPHNYIKDKYEFIRYRIPHAPNLFYLAWNGFLVSTTKCNILESRKGTVILNVYGKKI